MKLGRLVKAPPTSLSGSIFGVGVRIRAEQPDVLGAMADWLPPAWREGEEGVEPVSFVIGATGDQYELSRDGTSADRGSLDDMLGSYELQLRNHVAQMAPEHVFVHAGTAAVGDRAIVVPGASFSGKTTMVSALVSAGAAYCSDEYAVFDAEGRVHPYPKPLAVRDGGSGYRGKTYHEPERFGALAGDQPLRLGLVLCTQYRRGAEWEPIELTPAQAMLELLPHTFRPPSRAAETLATLGAAFNSTVQALKGDRGDAAELAPRLLANFRDSVGQGTS